VNLRWLVILPFGVNCRSLFLRSSSSSLHDNKKGSSKTASNDFTSTSRGGASIFLHTNYFPRPPLNGGIPYPVPGSTVFLEVIQRTTHDGMNLERFAFKNTTSALTKRIKSNSIRICQTLFPNMTLHHHRIEINYNSEKEQRQFWQAPRYYSIDTCTKYTSIQEPKGGTVTKKTIEETKGGTVNLDIIRGGAAIRCHRRTESHESAAAGVEAGFIANWWSGGKASANYKGSADQRLNQEMDLSQNVDSVEICYRGKSSKSKATGFITVTYSRNYARVVPAAIFLFLLLLSSGMYVRIKNLTVISTLSRTKSTTDFIGLWFTSTKDCIGLWLNPIDWG